MKNKLSVVLATHNEEANLVRCLEAIQALADQIVVVDGESTDKTLEIAHSFNAEVIKTTNKSNFHINKQQAMDAATGQLVLQLDADEIVDQELKTFIQSLLKSEELTNNFQSKAWWLKRKNLFLNTWLTKGGQYPDPVIRLYVNGFAQLPQKSVHEQMEVKGQVGEAPGHLLHYSNPQFSDYLRKFNTYTSFTAQQLFDEKFPLKWSHTLNFMILKPVINFGSLYFRHRGYKDGWAGFVFALMSALHHPVAYLKLWEVYETQKNQG